MGLKTTWTVYAGWPPPQPPGLELPDDPALELCSVTFVTPSIRRRRSSSFATVGWLVAHPEIAKTGTLPGGVAEVTPPAAAEDDDPPPAPEDDDEPPPDVEPTAPESEATDTPEGRTRPNSWNA